MTDPAEFRSITDQFFGTQDAEPDREGAWLRLAILAVQRIDENTRAVYRLVNAQEEKEDSGMSLLDRVLRLTERYS